MNDLQLWRLLQETHPDPDTLAELLTQLAEMPLADRVPYLAHIPQLTEHKSEHVRAAAVRTLVGATGFITWQTLTTALDDPSPLVQQATIDAMVVSCREDPGRWVHAIFHPNGDLRKKLIAVADPTPELSWHMLALLSDPDCRTQVETKLESSVVWLADLPRFLHLLSEDLISERLARRIMVKIDWKDVFAQLNHFPHRTSAQVFETLFAAEKAMTISEIVLAEQADVLDTIISVYWHKATDEEETRITNRFFHNLSEYLSGEGKPHLAAVVASLISVAVRRGFWLPRAADFCAAFHPAFLNFAWIDEDDRRKCLPHLYRAGAHLVPADENFIRKLVKDTFCQSPTGNVDLWATGAVLHLLKTEPCAHMLKWFTLTKLIDSFLEEPDPSAAFFTLNDKSKRGVKYLLRRISETGKLGNPIRLCLQILTTDVNDFLTAEKMTPNDALEVYLILQRWEARPELAFAPAKFKAVAQYVARYLGEGKSLDFFATFLELDNPQSSEIGMAVFTEIAQSTPQDEMADHAQRLDDERLKKLLQVIADCPGFLRASEVQIAIALHEHANEEIRNWAADRIPKPAPTAPVMKSSSSSVVPIPDKLAEDIATCSVDQLSRAIQPCLHTPMHGLCAVLTRRTEDSPNLEVCLALLACHDPVDQVAAQFDRFCRPSPKFHKEIERRVVQVWRGEVQLTVLGHSWLYHWQDHTRALADFFDHTPAGLIRLLKFTLAWKSQVLQEKVWAAVANLLSMWRWHEVDKFKLFATDEMAKFLIPALPGPTGVSAAGILTSFCQSSELSVHQMVNWTDMVHKVLPDSSMEVRKVLAVWIDSSGLPNEPVVPRAEKLDLSAVARAHIKTATELDELETWCRSEDVTIVEEAALRLIELEEPGVERLLKLMQSQPFPTHLATVVMTVSLWPEGDSRSAVRELVLDRNTPPLVRFIAGLELVGIGQKELLEEVLDSVRQPAEPSWFMESDWQRLRDTGLSPRRLAVRLAVSPHPHAYTRAVKILTDPATPHTIDFMQARRAFLDCGTDRLHRLRLEVAQLLHERGDAHGFPLLMAESFSRATEQFQLLQKADADLIRNTVWAAMVAGTKSAEEWKLFEMIKRADHEPEAQQEGYQALLTTGVTSRIRQLTLQELKYRPARAHKIRRVAETYAWGVRRGRELTGQLFQIEMIAGKDLGYTRFTDNKLFISPLPILRADQNGKDVVEGLILHELGHHIYHRNPGDQDLWKQAHDEGIGRVLNLVSDEHLERNLRARDEEFGDRLKKLCSYAFQHSTKEMAVTPLLSGLGTRAFAVLTKSKLLAAREPGHVKIESGQLLSEMERSGMSFARFCRSLRMGLGNRHKDPKVAMGLDLFRNKFRDSSMATMLDISRKLREIFGEETKILDSMGQDSLLMPSEGDLHDHGEGITSEELQSEVTRVLNPEQQPDRDRESTPQNEAKGGQWINVNPDEFFNTITNIVHLDHDPLAHARYAERVKRHARQMQRYLIDLGIRMDPQRQRMRGKSLDRTRLKSVVLRGDPRMLIARELTIKTYLFIGVVIDCSGSMVSGSNIEKAKLFGTLLAEAVKNNPNIDLRLFGFTSAEIYDAGSAQRCAAHALRAHGGNNDAAGLWHAAQAAFRSHRRSKLLVMVSDGLPTECSVAALRGLVHKLTRRWKVLCAQVAVRPLTEICFPHYVLLEESEMDASVRQFGKVVSRLVKQALTGG